MSNNRGRTKLATASPTLGRINDLPNNVIDDILACLPIGAMVRTSVLSKKWRHRWAEVPQLVFDDNFLKDVKDSVGNDLLMQTIYEVLLLHSGPIQKFTLSISGFKGCPEIDPMILYLSRKGIEDLNLHFSSSDYYKLPSYVFSCLQLRCLTLSYCIFKTPPMFKGFSKLITIEFRNVQFDTSAFKMFILNCPLLEKLVLDGCTDIFYLEIDSPMLKFLHYKGYYRSVHFSNTPLLATVSILGGEQHPGPKVWKLSNLIEVFNSLPAIEQLAVDFTFLKAMALCDAPQKLPTTLNHLKVLELYGFCFEELDQVLSSLCLLRSSPNLQILRIESELKDCKRHVLESVELQDHFDFSLDQLQEVNLQFITGAKHEVAFIEFLLAKSSALKKMLIKKMRVNMNADEVLKLLMKAIQFKRASPNAEIICEYDMAHTIPHRHLSYV